MDTEMRTCTACRQTQPIEQYARHKRYKGGRDIYCRSCTARFREGVKVAQIRAEAGIVIEEPPIPVGDKECLCCGERKPYSNFGVMQRSPDKRNYYCRKCLAAMRAGLKVREGDAWKQRSQARKEAAAIKAQERLAAWIQKKAEIKAAQRAAKESQ